jgi:hypothetical protein
VQIVRPNSSGRFKTCTSYLIHSLSNVTCMQIVKPNSSVTFRTCITRQVLDSSTPNMWAFINAHHIQNSVQSIFPP